MYRNAITPSKLFALILLVFSATGAILWVGCLVDPEASAFDLAGLILLESVLVPLVLSILFLRRARSSRLAASIFLHVMILALAALFLYTLSMAETPLETAVVAGGSFLGTGLLFAGIVGLHSDAMAKDLAGDNPPPAHTRSLNRRFFLGAVGCMAILLILAAWRIVPLLVAQPTITVDYLAQANQANKPADYDPNHNAATWYEKLFSEFAPLPGELADLRDPWPGDLEPNDFKALAEWATLNDSALTSLAQAAKRPYWWFEMQSDTGALSGIQIPYTQEMRACFFGCILLAKFKANQGNVGGAMRLLADTHMMGVHRAEGGTLLEQLTGAAVCERVYRTALAILEHCKVDADLLQWTLDTLNLRLSRIAVPRFSEVERLYGFDSIQRNFTNDGHGDGKLIPERLYTTKKNRRSFYTFPISYPKAVWICVTHPGRRETESLAQAYAAFVPDLARQTPWELYVQNTTYEKRLADLLHNNYYHQDGLAAIGPCIRVGWQSRVTGEATMTVLAVFLFKAQEGRLPESLEQLVDAHLLQSVPMDPYSGAPLIYRVTKDDFTLYSVGEDFVDNGGSPGDWTQAGADRVFWPIAKP